MVKFNGGMIFFDVSFIPVNGDVIGTDALISFSPMTQMIPIEAAESASDINNHAVQIAVKIFNQPFRFFFCRFSIQTKH